MQLSFSSKHFATLFHSVANSLKIKVQPMVSELIQTWPGVSGHCWFSWLCFWQWGKWGKLIGHEKKSFGKSVTLFLFPWQVDIWQQTWGPWDLNESHLCSYLLFTLIIIRVKYSFDPWVGKIPWRRKWQPTPEFLPGKSHGQRSLVDYSPWGCKESDPI